MTQKGDFQVSRVGPLSIHISKEPGPGGMRRASDQGFGDIAGVFLCNFAESQGMYNPSPSQE